jgi:anti-sigma regulatory factor (Ser/Thr protein kinase)
MNRDSSLEILNESFPSIKGIRKKIINTIFETLNENNIRIKLNDNELYLIIDEALTNAMEHGNKWDPKKSVNVTVTRTSELINIKVSDEGKGFNHHITDRDRESIKSLKPRGRGILIIKKFCNPRWNKSGNQINLEIPISK